MPPKAKVTRQSVLDTAFDLVRAQGQVNVPPPLVRLRGLDPAKRYRIAETGEAFGGDELSSIGLLCPLRPGASHPPTAAAGTRYDPGAANAG